MFIPANILQRGRRTKPGGRKKLPVITSDDDDDDSTLFKDRNLGDIYYLLKKAETGGVGLDDSSDVDEGEIPLLFLQKRCPACRRVCNVETEICCNCGFFYNSTRHIGEKGSTAATKKRKKDVDKTSSSVSFSSDFPLLWEKSENNSKIPANFFSFVASRGLENNTTLSSVQLGSAARMVNRAWFLSSAQMRNSFLHEASLWNTVDRNIYVSEGSRSKRKFKGITKRKLMETPKKKESKGRKRSKK